MIINGNCYVFSLPDPLNKDNNWDLLLNQYIFTLDYMKHHVKSLQRVSKADQYVVHHMTWSGVYLRSTFSNNLLQKILILVPLTSTGPEVFVATTNTFLSVSYDDLEETLTHMKSLKLKIYPGDNVEDCLPEILVDSERLKIAGAFNLDHPGHITCIFEDTYDSIFCLWGIHKYKEVT